MKEYTAKTLELALEKAGEELGVEQKNINYDLLEEKRGLFGKKSVKIVVYEDQDVVDYACEYLVSSIESLGILANAEGTREGELIKISIDSEHNPILIGKNGRTLQAFNELVKLALSTKFKRRYRVLLDVGDYKDKKYSHVAHIARKVAKEVQKTKTSVKLSAMTPDERRVVHNALANFSHIKTESEGEGNARAVVIKYVD